MGRFFGRDVTQVTLLLRLVCGGYLLYLAWELREAVFGPERQLAFILAAALFAVVGLLLCVFDPETVFLQFCLAFFQHDEAAQRPLPWAEERQLPGPPQSGL